MRPIRVQLHTVTFSKDRGFPRGLQGYFDPRRGRISGFTEDGKAAMAASPDYFLWWYSVKSLGLVAVAVGLGYVLGRASR